MLTPLVNTLNIVLMPTLLSHSSALNRSPQTQKEKLWQIKMSYTCIYVGTGNICNDNGATACGIHGQLGVMAVSLWGLDSYQLQEEEKVPTM